MKKLKLLLVILLLIIVVGCKDKEFVINVDTPISDEIKFDFEEIGTDLLRDGTKKVELKKCVDGDTAHFTTGVYKDGTLIDKVRFLGIDTPETYNPGAQPFGYAASQLTCKILTDAKEIILEIEKDNEIFDGYDRLLAYVWVDGKLLNAQIVELGLAALAINKNNKYYDDIFAAYLYASDEELGIHGYELDPNWDYEKSKNKKCSYSSCLIDKNYKYKFNFPKK